MPIADHKASAARDYRLVAVIVACGAVNSVNVAKLAPTIQTLQSDFGLSLSEVGLLASLFSTLIVLMALAVASAIRAFGARRMLLLSLSVAAIGSLISLVSQNIAGLFIGRMIEGASLVTVMLTAPAILSEHTHVIRRGVIMGIWGGFMPLGNSVALMFAPILLDLGSWQAVWQAGLWATLLMLALAFWYIPNDHNHTPKKLQFHVISLAIRNKAAGILGLVFAAHSLVYQALLQLMPVFNQSIIGLSLSWASYFTVMFCLLNFAGNIISGQLLQRNWAPSKLVFLTGSALTMLLLAMVCIASMPIFFAIALLMFGIIAGGSPPVCFYVISRQKTDSGNIPMLMAWMFQIQGFGMLLGPVYFTMVVEHSASWIIGTIALIPFTLVMALLSLPISDDTR